MIPLRIARNSTPLIDNLNVMQIRIDGILSPSRRDVGRGESVQGPTMCADIFQAGSGGQCVWKKPVTLRTSRVVLIWVERF